MLCQRGGMIRFLFALLVVVGSGRAVAVGAAPVAVASLTSQLRAAVRLPQIAFNLEPQFGRKWGVTAGEDVADPAAELARLSATLKGVPADAPVQLHLFRLALLTGDTNAAGFHAAALGGFRKLAEEHPDDPVPALGMARLLWLAGDEAAAEPVIRAVTTKQATNGEAWILQGEILAARSIKVFTGWTDEKSPNPMAAYVLGALKPKGDLAAARAMFDEAEKCLERARKIAPEEPRLWAASVPYLLDREMRRRVLANPQEPEARQAAVSLLNQAAAGPEVEAVLKRVPDDFRLLGLSIYLHILPELSEGGIRLGFNPDGARPIDLLRSETRSWVRERQARIENLATHLTETASGKPTSKQRRAGAAEMAGAYQYVLFANGAAATRFAKLALELDPSRQRAMELVVAGMVNERRWTDLQALCEQRIRLYDHPLPRLLLAKSQFNEGRKEPALATLTAANERFPQDRLLLAALLAARVAVADIPEDSALLARLHQLFPDPANTPDDTDASRSVVMSALIAQAIGGETAVPKKVLRSMLGADPTDVYANAVLDLLRSDAAP